MSITKRVWIDRDPEYAEARAAYLAEAPRPQGHFNVRLPTRRRASHGGWNPLWPSGLTGAAKELGIKYRLINWGMFFRTREDADAVRQRAETLIAEQLAALVGKKPPPS